MKPLYYICGTDDYLKKEALKEIRSKVLTPGMEDLNFEEFSGRSVNTDEVVKACYTMPFMTGSRVVLLSGEETFKGDKVEPILEYLEDPSPDTCLVIVGGAKAPPKTTRLAKAIGKVGEVKVCNHLSGDKLKRWVLDFVNSEGMTISPVAVDKFLGNTGSSLREVKSELTKLIIFASGKSEITEADVDECGIDIQEKSIFELADSIGSKDISKALKVLKSLSREPLPLLLGSISRQFRILLMVKSLSQRGVPPKEMARIIGMSPYYFDNYIKRSRHFTLKELRGAIGLLRGADIDFKSGRLPESVILPSLVTELCGL